MIVLRVLLFLLLLPLWPLHWLLCRLTAERCPSCGSKWRTEKTGEWDGEEDWHCHRCGRWWAKPYAPPHRRAGSEGHPGL